MINHQYTPHIRPTELSIVILELHILPPSCSILPTFPCHLNFLIPSYPFLPESPQKSHSLWRCISSEENWKIKLINWENFPRLRITWKQDSSFKWISEVVDHDTASPSEDGSRRLIHTDTLFSPLLPAMHRMENSPTSLKTHDGWSILNACVSLKVIY